MYSHYDTKGSCRAILIKKTQTANGSNSLGSDVNSLGNRCSYQHRLTGTGSLFRTNYLYQYCWETTYSYGIFSSNNYQMKDKMFTHKKERGETFAMTSRSQAKNQQHAEYQQTLDEETAQRIATFLSQP